MKSFNNWSRLSASALGTARYRGVMSCIVIALYLVAVPAALYGQKLDDFKDAASKDKGPDLIPFDDLRSKARDLDAVVKSRKDDVDKLPDLESFKRRKENKFAEIKALKDDCQKELDDLAKYNIDPDVPSDLMLKTVKQCQDDCTAIETKYIANINDQMTKAADAYDQLAKARADLRDCFSAVKDKLSDAKSNPGNYLASDASDDDKKQLGDYIDKITASIASQEDTHKQQEDAMKQKSDDLKALISRTS